MKFDRSILMNAQLGYRWDWSVLISISRWREITDGLRVLWRAQQKKTIDVFTLRNPTHTDCLVSR